MKEINSIQDLTNKFNLLFQIIIICLGFSLLRLSNNSSERILVLEDKVAMYEEIISDDEQR